MMKIDSDSRPGPASLFFAKTERGRRGKERDFGLDLIDSLGPPAGAKKGNFRRPW